MRTLGLQITESEKAKNLAASNQFRMQYRMTQQPLPNFSWLALKKVTPVKDQGDCGSCVGFGTLGTVEACLAIRDSKIPNHPQDYKDLSEAYMFKKGGGSCANGWTFKPACNFMKGVGTVDEAIDPYHVPLSMITQAMDKAPHTKIVSWQQLLRNTEAKLWIATYGPIITGMTVYDDFPDYRGGIYQAKSKNVLGGHCVSVVGYDDAQQCWICKNSWGTGWGEQGFFRIGYDQDIGLAYGFYGVRV
jgi:C1A family cysteine protease